MAHPNPIEIQKHLKGMDYPANKQDLIKHAREHGADEEVCKILEHLPDDRFETAADVSKAVGKVK